MTSSTARSAELRDRLRLVGIGGSNKIMAGELSRLVRRAYDDVRVPIPLKEGPGAVSYPFDVRLASTAVRYHRTSARVLWERYRSAAQRLEPLYDELRRAIEADERRWTWDGASISVRAFGVDAFPAGQRQVVGTIKNAIVDAAAAFGERLRVEPTRPDLTIDVRWVDDQLSIALDMAGMPMHHRGYRHAKGEAPLREDLAAFVVMLTRHDSRSEIVVDPMAGSATIGIEAACLGQGKGVWCSGRAPACLTWPSLAATNNGKSSAIFADTKPAVFLNELDPTLAAMAARNVETAGVGSLVNVRQGDFRTLTREQLDEFAVSRGMDPKKGVIICNPPYGQRLGSGDMRPLYADLGAWARTLKGYRAGFLVANRDFEAAFGLHPRVRKPVSNGPLDAVFYLYDL